MSNPRPDLPVDKASAKCLVEELSKNPFVKTVYLNGSRSPNSKRKARDDSDWDFVCCLKFDCTLQYNQPRARGLLHGDVVFVKESMIDHYFQRCEVWPTDKQKVFSNE